MDGTLLQPSFPLTPLERTLLMRDGLGPSRSGKNNWPPKGNATAWGTYTSIPSTALLGEVDKLTRVSFHRFQSVTESSDGAVQTTLRGKPGEEVHLAFVTVASGKLSCAQKTVIIGANVMHRFVIRSMLFTVFTIRPSSNPPVATMSNG